MTCHLPVLVEPVLKAFQAASCTVLKTSAAPLFWVVDCTVGGGGHTAALLKAIQEHPEPARFCLLGLDQDPQAIQKAQYRFRKEVEQGLCHFVHGSFGDFDELLGERWVCFILLDLGLSSDQLADASRGFSFKAVGPLDMRFNPLGDRPPASELVARATQAELEQWISKLGEERFARQIAAALIYHRGQGRVPGSADELAQWIIHALPPQARHQKIHAATRTFQALRMVVNEEEKELYSFLNSQFKGLVSGGQMALISFHSLEARILKIYLKQTQRFRSVYPKPIFPGKEEVKVNPRSRSAQLRLWEKN